MPNALLRHIQQAVQAGDVEIADHALLRMLERQIDLGQIVEGVMRAKLLEDYSSSRQEPRLLVAQRDATGREIHVVWEASEDGSAVLVTVFEPER